MTSPDPHQVQAFADGQLSSVDADRFRDHLGSCEKCQLELHTLLQLDAAAHDSKDAMPVPARAPRRVPSWLAPLLGLATAAGIAAFVLLRTGGSDITLGGSRKLEARVGWSSGDAYRPYDAMRGAASGEDIPLDVLAQLQKKGDVAALAGAMLLSGDAQKARALLEKLDASPDIAADLAAVALAQGRPEDALELANSALEKNPKHPRALWNSALAARELGFLAVAAKTFGEVAKLNEPGWAKEATDRQAALDRQWKEASKRYVDTLNAGVKMTLEHTPMSPELVATGSSTARLYLAYAMRSARSAAEARALLPVAKQLDDILGPESKAVASLERAAAQQFDKRARLTELERAMFVDYFRGRARFGVTLDVPEAERGLSEADRAELLKLLERDANADDLVLAISFLGLLPDDLERYTLAAAEVNEPWFLLAAQNERARAIALSDVAVSERGLLDVIARGARSAPLRVMQANEQLAGLYMDQHRAAEEQALIFGALPLTRAQGDVLFEGRLLSLLGDAARFRNLKGLTHAALEERALRLPTDCYAQRYLHESMALIHLSSFDANKMRADLDAAVSCGEPLSIVGMSAVADLVRLSGDARDSARFDAALVEFKKTAEPDEAAMAIHLEGRVRIDQDPAKGEKLLRDAMDAARKLDVGHSYVRKIPSYGYVLLRLEAGRQKRFDQVLALTAEELGRELPATCALVVDAEDDRVTVAARDGSGKALGVYTHVSLDKPHPQFVEVSEIAAIVKPIAETLQQGCATRAVSVFTGFPLNGQGGWLPDSLPWSFASALPERSPVPGSRLVVSEVDAPRELQLPRLQARSRDIEGTVSLRGAEATPERVLAGMEKASFIELEAHGMVNPASEDAAMVVLAPGSSGFALTVSKVRTARLEHHPIVLLGACKAATVAPYLHERWSLPHAFLQAGARAVIAAPVDLPDTEAREFFATLVDRLASGTPPAIAVAEERSKWLSSGRAGWVRAVLVFD